MTFSDDTFIRIVVFLLAGAGFLVARHIYKHKKPGQTPLVCPMNFDCETVVHSDYSKFLGISVEVFGMIYYGVMFFSYLILVFSPEMLPPLLASSLVLVSMAAFLFSLYLICLQIFVLKKGCFWCFVSSVISVLIFILSFHAFEISSIAKIFLR